MISQLEVQGYGMTLSELSTAALVDLQALLLALEGESPERTRSVLSEAFPDVMNPHVAAASAVSATFYEEVRDAANVRATFAAQTLDEVDAPRWQSLIGWGSKPLSLEQGGSALVYSLLSGGLTKILREVASDTIIGNGALERVQVGYQRVPSPGCCAFCGMIASRGDITKSASDAERVVGRGVPIEKNYADGGRRRRGGRAGGIKPRGSRAIGELYHDHCKCKGVPVFEDNYVEMQADAEAYYDAYGAARDEVAKERAAKGYAGYGDQKTSMQMTLAKMRQDLGVK